MYYNCHTLIDFRMLRCILSYSYKFSHYIPRDASVAFYVSPPLWGGEGIGYQEHASVGLIYKGLKTCGS